MQDCIKVCEHKPTRLLDLMKKQGFSMLLRNLNSVACKIKKNPFDSRLEFLCKGIGIAGKICHQYQVPSQQSI
jgi:hypothetical protein